MLDIDSAKLVLTDCHTPNPRVFWLGVEVPGVKSIHVDNGGGTTLVVIELYDNPIYHEMRGQGITVSRQEPPVGPPET